MTTSSSFVMMGLHQVSTHSAGWSSQLNVTPVKSSETGRWEQRLPEHEPRFVLVSGDIDSRHIMQNTKGQMGRLFAVEMSPEDVSSLSSYRT